MTGPVYAGGLAGVAAAYPCGWAVGFPQEFLGVLLGSAMAVLCAAPLHRWVVQGRLPAPLTLIPLVVLLVDLLAAGAVGYPGVSQTGWLLMAAALNQFDARCWRFSISRPLALGLLLRPRRSWCFSIARPFSRPCGCRCS